MTAPMPTGERPTLRSYAPVPLLTALVSAAACAGAVVAAPQDIRVPLAWGAGGAALLLCLTVTVAARALVAKRLLERRLDTVAQDAGRLVRERARLVEEFTQERGRLMAEVTRENHRLTAELAQERVRLTAELDDERTRRSAELDKERARLDSERERLAEQHAQLARDARRFAAERDAAVAATANAAGRMQALATGTLADLRTMEERHADEDVLADLLHLDHRTAQAGRLADSVAVLSGARSGRRWARPIGMESILRGAMGRIGGYQRVRLHSASATAITGHAAEAVMHALAELLDNAANFSPPTAEVHVYVEEVPSGVIVSVEDSGLVMGETQLRRAERAVSGDGGGLTGLSGTRLGLAVVGRLARKYGLRVSFRPSARGGTGVLMLIPQDLLTPTDAPRPTSLREATATRTESYEAAGSRAVRQPYDSAATDASPAAPHPADDPAPEPMPGHEPATSALAEGPATDAGLPKRLRGHTLAAAERARDRAPKPAGAPTTPKTPPPCDAYVRAARFSTFRQAVRGSGGTSGATGTTPSAPDVPGTPDTPGTSDVQRPESSVQIRALDPADSSAAAYSTLLADMLGRDGGTGPQTTGAPAGTLSHPEGDPTS